MAATRRLQKELGDLRKSGLKSFRDIQVGERGGAEHFLINQTVLWRNNY